MLTVEVQASAGQDIAEAIEEMCILASRLGCLVIADLNGVRTMAKPGCDPRDLFAQWDSELASKRPYKIVCAQPVTLTRAWDRSAETQGEKP